MRSRLGCCDGDDTQSIDTVPSGMTLHHVPTDYDQVPYPYLNVDPCPSTCTDSPQTDCAPISAAPCGTRTVTQRCSPPCNPPCSSCRPHYRQPCMAPEDSRQVVLREKLVGTFKNKGAFAMPACGAKVRVEFDKVGDVPIGAWLWAYGLGYLKITAFFPTSGEVELENECLELDCGTQVQAAPGTPIPKCTVFVIQAPLCSGATSSSILNFPYLAGSFTTPMNGACVDVPVTNTNGLSVNAVVSVGGSNYRIGNIYSATLIQICNDGGAVAGAYVEFEDGAGNKIVPISLIQSNICLNTGVSSGKIVVCKNNTQQPLTGLLDGQIPIFDLATGEVTFQTVDVPILDCTVLTSSIVINPTFPPGTYYTAAVSSSAAFTPGQNIRIGGSSFNIINIPDATHATVLPLFPIVGFETFNPGATFCSVGCCEELDTRVTALEINPNGAEGNEVFSAAIVPTLLAAQGETVTSPTIVLGVTNNSPVSSGFNMGVLFHATTYHRFDWEGTAGTVAEIDNFFEWSGVMGTQPIVPAALPVGVLVTDPRSRQVIALPGAPAVNRDSHFIHRTFYAAIPSGGNMVVALRARTTLNGTTLTTGVRVLELGGRISLLGVAVR